MIYACLKTIPQWNTPWTPINYITIGIYLGGLIFFALLSFNDFNDRKITALGMKASTRHARSRTRLQIQWFLASGSVMRVLRAS